MSSLHSIHIVGKFGPVGGMENYVWQLTHALIQLGHAVTVICETSYDHPNSEIEIIKVGEHFAKPRWLSMLLFSQKVERALSSINTKDKVIHSHERCRSHHISTFHGPPIVCRKKSMFDTFSPRLRTWEFLEKRELSANNVDYVVPNSTLAKQQLKTYYPSQENKVTEPIFAGVAPIDETKKAPKKAPDNQYVIGFIGKEWKRKGLDLAVKIVARLRQQNPNIHLLVAGCARHEVASLFDNWQDGYTLLEWVQPEDFYTQIDLLIHPARIEPFGMVIAEANQYKVPVLISDKCGIANLIGTAQGKVLSLTDETQWEVFANQLLSTPPQIETLNLTWENCTLAYLDLYKKILAQ